MKQVARNLTTPGDGFLVDTRYLLVVTPDGRIRRRDRLGGLLRYYYRDAA